jgi:glycosyltransferase involved in cell wall biosynthesis
MESVKKVLIVSPIFPPDIGGPSSYIKGLVENKPTSLDLQIVAFCSKTPIKILDNQQILTTNGISLTRQLALLTHLLPTTRKAYVIYSQGTVTVGYACIKHNRILKKRLILKFVGDEIWENYRKNPKNTDALEEFYDKQKGESRLLKIHRDVLLAADAIVTPSQYLKDFLVKYHQVNDSKIHIIPNPIEIKNPIKYQKIKNQLVVVGRLVPWKHVDQVIRAVDNARNSSNNDYKLVIVGDGPEIKRINKVVQELHANDWATFMGSLAKADTYRVIGESHKLILYSSYEGMSHSIIESWRLGTPVIVSSIKANTMLVKDYAQKVRLDDIDSLAEAINEPPADLPSESFLQQFSWENHFKSLLQEM